MTKQTLDQAMYLARSGKSPSLRSAARALDGRIMGDAATRQAMSDVRTGLPLQSQRSYTIEEFIACAYYLESDRYRTVLTDEQIFGGEA